jgi:hypothetical protein
MKRHSLNPIGLAEIRLFLSANHRRAHMLTDREIHAIAADVERRLDHGLSPLVRVSPKDCIVGDLAEHRLSSAGYFLEEFEDVIDGRWLVEVRIGEDWFDAGWNGGDDFDSLEAANSAIRSLNSSLGWPVEHLRVRVI